jgi:hypothetical protein
MHPQPGVFDWLTRFFTTRGKVLALYRRGMAKAEKHDHQGALQDYDAAIQTSGSPADVRAMALYNRALVFAAIGENGKATEDLEFVLAMEESFVNIKTMAKQKLARMVDRASKKPGK